MKSERKNSLSVHKFFVIFSLIAFMAVPLLLNYNIIKLKYSLYELFSNQMKYEYYWNDYYNDMVLYVYAFDEKSIDYVYERIDELDDIVSKNTACVTTSVYFFYEDKKEVKRQHILNDFIWMKFSNGNSEEIELTIDQHSKQFKSIDISDFFPKESYSRIIKISGVYFDKFIFNNNLIKKFDRLKYLNIDKECYSENEGIISKDYGDYVIYTY